MSSLKTLAKRMPTELNPRTTKLEFFGVPGTSLLLLVVPLVPYLLYFSCSEENGGCTPNVWDLSQTLLHDFSTIDGVVKKLWDPQAMIVFHAWLVYLVACWAILPGDWVQGSQLRDGTHQQYKINALQTMLLTLGFVGGTIYNFGPQSFTFLYEHYLGLITASFVSSYVQSFILYYLSFRGEKLLALAANSGYFSHDFWLGRELNPTFGSFDLKTFYELRPGLIGWFLLNISSACEQAVRRGGSITNSMALILLFQGWYVFDALYNEPAIFTQMDTITDGLGVMLTFGDLCWVPMTYTLQARYLAFNPVELSPYAVAGVLATQAVGYYIFRTSNGEKNDFRNGKNPKNLSFMETKRGTRLLTSGWWGVSQHPNYMGDLIMAVAWCLPTGFNTPITYFYPAYFLILLLHRQTRDDEACHEKYGDDWLEYKKRVPYRIFPYVY